MRGVLDSGEGRRERVGAVREGCWFEGCEYRGKDIDVAGVNSMTLAARMDNVSREMRMMG